MNNDQNAEIFFKKLIVGFGFLNGIWIAIGINPEAEFFKTLKEVIDTINPENQFSILFIILPLIVLIATLILIKAIGGWLGFAAVGSGFIGGLLVLTSPTISIIFLLAGWGLGIIATDN
ncbi:MAG: hypothetical protein KAI84_13100 [Gammaproteobacteria bacterium]|nr:hypothetical protein [Gammaproteobacteria bacterium]